MRGTQTATYKRRLREGTLALSGTVDIFEASALHAAARRALRDTKAASISIDLKQAERLDIAAIQILLALRAGVEADGRTFTLANTPRTVSKTLAQIGFPGQR